MDYQKLFEITEQILILRGGKGSGNFGHKGRKGKRGGSGKGRGKGSISAEDKKKATELYEAFKSVPNSPVMQGPDTFYNTIALMGGAGGPKGVLQEMANLYENDDAVPKPKTLSLPSNIKAKNIGHRETVESFKPWMDNLSEDEKAGLRGYQRGNYEAMNDHLRKGREILDMEMRDIKDAKKALGKSKLKEDTILYRGTEPEAFISQLGSDPQKWIGGVFTDKGFMSTSIDKSSAFGAPVKATILAPKGTKGGYLGDLPPPHRHNEGEKEMLLSPGVRMRIIGVDIGQTGRLEGIKTEIIGQD